MRIVFMGTPDFAVPPLKALLNSRHEVIAVVTQPDKPNARGNKVIHSPTKKLALEHSIPVLQPKRIRDEGSIGEVVSLKPDIVVVVAYGQLLPKEILEYPRFGCVNIHASLLPKYRGSAPINWCIINGDEKSGVTTMYMDEGMDTGDIIYQTEVKITDTMTSGELYEELAQSGADLLLKTLEDLEKGTAPRIKQDESTCSYAPMLNKDTGRIDWRCHSDEIFNLIRGTNPWPVAFTYYKDTKLKVYSASRFDGKVDSSAVPGEIIRHEKGNGLLVKTGDGALYLDVIQFPNKKRMKVDDFLRGNAIDMDTILN